MSQEIEKYKNVPIGDSDNATSQAFHKHIYNYINSCPLTDQTTSDLNGSTYLHLFHQKASHQQPESVEISETNENTDSATHVPTLQQHLPVLPSDVTEKDTISRLFVAPTNYANRDFPTSVPHKRKSSMNESFDDIKSKKLKGNF